MSKNDERILEMKKQLDEKRSIFDIIRGNWCTSDLKRRVF